MKAMDKKIGLLINFSIPRLKEGRNKKANFMRTQRVLL